MPESSIRSFRANVIPHSGSTPGSVVQSNQPWSAPDLELTAPAPTQPSRTTPVANAQGSAHATRAVTHPTIL